MPARAASRRPPPRWKISSWWPQLGQTKPLMFSTRPSTGTSTFCHIASAFSTSMIDTSCGVVTMTAPVTGSSCDSDSCASPVPGGRSTIR